MQDVTSEGEEDILKYSLSAFIYPDARYWRGIIFSPVCSSDSQSVHTSFQFNKLKFFINRFHLNFAYGFVQRMSHFELLMRNYIHFLQSYGPCQCTKRVWGL